MKALLKKFVVYLVLFLILFLLRDYLLLILSHCLLAALSMLIYCEVRSRMLYRRRVRHEAEYL